MASRLCHNSICYCLMCIEHAHGTSPGEAALVAMAVDHSSGSVPRERRMLHRSCMGSCPETLPNGILMLVSSRG